MEGIPSFPNNRMHEHPVNFGTINSEQKQLLKELQKGNLDPAEIRTQFLALQEQKVNFLLDEGKITEAEGATMTQKATEFIDKHLGQIEEQPPEEPGSTAPSPFEMISDEEKKKKDL